MIPSCCYVWPQGLGVVVELGRTWGVRHKHLRFAPLLYQVGSSGSAAMHCRDGCARRQTAPRSKLRHGRGLHRGNLAVRRLELMAKHKGDRASTSGAVTGSTHPAWEFLFFRPALKTARIILFLGTEEKGNRLEGSGNRSRPRKR